MSGSSTKSPLYLLPRYKKFSTEVEAREFVAGKDSPAVTEKVAEVDSSSIKELGKALKR